ncbi:unnamed protein product [Enterobius vermicularis]|uniref:VWFD domain-containing protein n=1 Tax=Enterobius vermicularis TaxID=51028 RepID=A0A0N4V975_ENTVE|nr:unnamed protein product [Enterobius vermicularis]
MHFECLKILLKVISWSYIPHIVMNTSKTSCQPLGISVLAKRAGVDFPKSEPEVKELYSSLKTKLFGDMDRQEKEVEDFISSIPKSQVIQWMRQLKPSGRSHAYIKEVMTPVAEFGRYLSTKTERLQKKLAALIDYLDQELHGQSVRAALDDFKKRAMDADILKTILIRLRKLAREYSLPDTVTGALNSVRDLIVDELCAKRVAQVVKALLDTITPNDVTETQIKKYWRALVDFSRHNLTSANLAEKLWKKYIPTITTKKDGETEILVKVPQSVKTLNDLTDMSDIADITHIFRRIEAELSEADKDRIKALKDTIYYFQSLPGEFFNRKPPFKSVAYLLGPSGYISFDGRPLPFSANCEYVLAADFVHKTFLITGKVNPNSNSRNPDMELKMEFRKQLVIDGKQEEHLPYQKIDPNDGVALITITRSFHTYEVKTYDGIHLTCNGIRNFCRLVLPGFMHGKSAGLLGSNDNEPSNDYDLISGEPNSNVNVMQEHWAINGLCRKNVVHAESEKDEECDHLFNNSDSPLSGCFSQVRPLPFEKLCLARKNLPTVAAVYRQACEVAGVEIEVPASYGGVCESPHMGSMQLGEQRNLVRKSSTSNAQFTWIGYGGEHALNPPHIHYMNGSPIYSTGKIQEIAKKPFENPSGLLPPEYSSVKAVLFAAQSFSPIFPKFFKPTDLPDGLQEMQRRNESPRVRRPDFLDGADGHNLYTETGSPIKNDNLYQPFDICSDASHMTGGGVFTLVGKVYYYAINKCWHVSPSVVLSCAWDSRKPSINSRPLVNIKKNKWQTRAEGAEKKNKGYAIAAGKITLHQSSSDNLDCTCTSVEDAPELKCHLISST